VPSAFRQWGLPGKSRFLQIAAVMALCLAPRAGAFDGATSSGQSVAAIEEDWIIIVDEPSFEEILPQLYVVTTPTGNLEATYSVFEINNLLLPDFYGGGLQFQTWLGTDATGEAHHNSFNALATAGETITFTVGMKLQNGNLQFQVKNGASTTWGAFGGNNSLLLSVPADVTSLASYVPELSAKLSRVGAGRGRVTKFQLKQIRYYDASGNLLSTDTNARDAQIDEPM
jgi:hypothetical protein